VLRFLQLLMPLTVSVKRVAAFAKRVLQVVKKNTFVTMFVTLLECCQ
jgi:hypothetical protein